MRKTAAIAALVLLTLATTASASPSKALPASTFAVDELTADHNIEAHGLDLPNGNTLEISNAFCIGLRSRGVMLSRDGYTERFAYLQCDMSTIGGHDVRGIYHGLRGTGLGWPENYGAAATLYNWRVTGLRVVY